MYRVAEQSKVWVCGRWFAGIAGSSTDGDMNICFL